MTIPAPWFNAQTEAILRREWERGTSTAQIGHLVGCSKNSIVSKARRLDLEKRDSPTALQPMWTAERDADLLQRRIAGEKPVHVAEVLGLSWSAVVKRYQRLDRGPPAYAQKRAAFAIGAIRPRAIGAIRHERIVLPEKLLLASERPPQTAPPEKQPPPVPVARLRECCWPFGEPGTNTFRFCDEPATPGRPYCGEHVRAAYPRLRHEDVAQSEVYAG